MAKGFCDLQGGAFQNGAFCGSNPCGGGGGEGACCAGTFCYQDTQENCEGAGRDFFGGPCEPSPCGGTSGACCTAEGCGSGLTPSECDGIGGLFLPNTSCTATTCDVGACCLEEGCQDVIQSVCNSMGGTWIVDSSCIDDACGIGACCAGATPTSECSMDTRLNCESFGRTFLGVGTVCSPNPCGVLSVIAACCTLEGCVELNQIDCAVSGGTFVASSPNCGPQTCVVGACCLEDGSCLDQIPSDCENLGGSHNASGLCFEISCPPAVLGACCVDLEPGATCIQALQSDCEAGGRVYIGDGISCASSPCRTCSTCDGDVDNNNARDGQDVSAFVECIIASGGAPGFVPAGCDCADMNHDFSVAMDDVGPMVNALLDTTGDCP
ncbi:MAG: hypothetical protein IPK83_12930 [Planctomycetes bacterium]|nr:hypothetical protein [Planctomycetota bacterium]